MELRFLDRGTDLTIECLTNDHELVYEFKAEFCDTSNYTTIVVESDELCDAFNKDEKFNDEIYLKVLFYKGFSLYSFKGRVKSISDSKFHRLVYISQISDITESTRRTYPRIEVSVGASLYSMSRQLLLSGTTLDISVEGLCLLSNTELQLKEEYYTLEFSLGKNAEFVLPAKLVRHGDCPQLMQFKYDYGFLFDFSENADEKPRMINSLFNHKMKGHSKAILKQG